MILSFHFISALAGSEPSISPTQKRKHEDEWGMVVETARPVASERSTYTRISKTCHDDTAAIHVVHPSKKSTKNKRWSSRRQGPFMRSAVLRRLCTVLVAIFHDTVRRRTSGNARRVPEVGAQCHCLCLFLCSDFGRKISCVDISHLRSPLMTDGSNKVWTRRALMPRAIRYKQRRLIDRVKYFFLLSKISSSSFINKKNSCYKTFISNLNSLRSIKFLDNCWCKNKSYNNYSTSSSDDDDDGLNMWLWRGVGQGDEYDGW